MYRRIGFVFLVATLLAGPGAALAAGSERASTPADRGPMIERIWDGLVRMLGLGEDDERGSMDPRTSVPVSLSAADEGDDDGSPQVDPNG